jgi:hypothetical protein
MERENMYAGALLFSFACLQEFDPKRSKGKKEKEALNPHRFADSSCSCLSLAESMRAHTLAFLI